ncbi:PasA protein [Pseudomonas syringae pv. coryli]|uniref:PasA protein n=2 Tax=Pseudomonas TaxID=286 RepID=A0A0P9MHI5_9PSED|nr:PasA protein [Pseudomonas syringae pv. coryli]
MVMESVAMAHELYTRTNQKIYFAGLSLEALGRAEKGQAVNSPALLQAERESALFHLYGALLGLCHEIAGYYRLPQAGARRAEELLTQEVLNAIAIPEMAELVELAQNRQTWLAQLLAAYNALYEPPRAPKKLKGDVTQPMIQAVNLDAEPESELSRAELENWRQQLKGLAIRFREGLSEC